jgi:hypothetical protein
VLFNALITLATVTNWTTAEVAFPIQIAVLAGLQVLLISGRLGPRLRQARAGAGPAASASILLPDAPNGGRAEGTNEDR